MSYVKSFMPIPDCSGDLLKRFVFEFTGALSQYFSFEGRLDTDQLIDQGPVRYKSPSEALALVGGSDNVSLFSIEHRSFFLLIDFYEDGIELLFNALTPDAGGWLDDIQRLASRILRRLCPN